MFKLNANSLKSCAMLTRAYRTRVSANKLSFYDVLGVTPKATHAQIKSAFYSLSKVYHPDVNQGNESVKKFSEITEAYTILGNHTLRRRYDRGILSPRDFRGEVKPEPKQPTMRKEGKIYTGAMYNASGEKVFDFDEFYKQTYGAQLAEEQRRRKRRALHREFTQSKSKKENKFFAAEAGTIIAGLLLVYLLHSLAKGQKNVNSNKETK
ncbi:dnaJ homolog subfamily C member 30, mitochondrial-like [Glandiceps talaboti]